MSPRTHRDNHAHGSAFFRSGDREDLLTFVRMQTFSLDGWFWLRTDVDDHLWIICIKRIRTLLPISPNNLRSEFTFSLKIRIKWQRLHDGKPAGILLAPAMPRRRRRHEMVHGQRRWLLLTSDALGVRKSSQGADVAWHFAQSVARTAHENHCQS